MENQEEFLVERGRVTDVRNTDIKITILNTDEIISADTKEFLDELILQEGWVKSDNGNEYPFKHVVSKRCSVVEGERVVFHVVNGRAIIIKC